MYLLVTEREGNYDYDYEHTETYDTFLELATAAKDDTFVAAYEIKEHITYERLSAFIAERKVKRAHAVAAARAKLTAEELELLGIA